MADTPKPQHIQPLADDEIADLANLVSSRRHPTPRERQLARAIRGAMLESWKAHRAQTKVSRTR